MPKARTMRQRCKQILNWYQHDRPCGRPVDIIWVRWTSKERKKDYAETVRSGSRLKIKMNSTLCTRMDVSIEILIHEYAHCRLWGMANVEDSDKLDCHDSVFWTEYGILYNMFHYLDGYQESKGYEF